MMAESVGIITYHAAFNYGSMLQAYALQQVILGLNCRCEIINFRTARQKEFYRPSFLRGRWLGKVKRIVLYFPYLHQLLRKQRLFNEFLSNELILSEKEYATLQDLKQVDFSYDCYLSGSDQIWNTSCFDFDWAYYLPFVKDGKRVAYAPSMGPFPEREVVGSNNKKIKALLSLYDRISVREAGTVQRISEIVGNVYPVMLDPTLLLSAEKWNEVAGEKPLIEEPYIFLYTPWYEECVFEAAKRLSQQLRLKIVVTQIYEGNANKWLYNKDFIPYLASGPKEFLNLCKYAACVIGSSFHIVVFSIVLRTPFFAINGMSDSRVSNLLRITGLESRSVVPEELSMHISLDVDFNAAHCLLEVERQQSISWLRDSLNV